jgi:hypothetical protein
MNKNEKLLAEAVETMLQHDAKLGLKMHDVDDKNLGENERGLEYLHGQIDEMFALKAAELTHANGVCQAFQKVHSYKYLDDPEFEIAMKKEMVAQAVPVEDRTKAVGFIPTIISELKEDQAEWAERDFGFNPALDDIKEASRPEQPLDFKIEEVEGWPTDANVEWVSGDASAGHTPRD